MTDDKWPWRALAACRDVDTSVFYPEGRGHIDDLYGAARAVCATCPVVGHCRREGDALEGTFTAAVHGYRSGETPGQRLRRRRAERRTAAA